MDKKQETKTPKSKFGLGFVCGIVLSVFVVLAGFGVQYLYDSVLSHVYKGAPAYQNDDNTYESAINERSLSKLEEMEKIIGENFYQADQIDGEEMEEGLYRGLLEALGDPYAAYYTVEELEAVLADSEGIFYGIGAMISYDERRQLAVISGIMPGGAAAASELREGDFIVAVDDVDTTRLSSGEVVLLIRGKEHTPVSITVYREGVLDHITMEMIRQKVEKNTVSHRLMDDPNIGYIQISEFDNITVGQFEDALSELKGQGIRGLVLDLRSNPGGNLTAVNAIARQLLPKGLIVYTEDGHGNREEYNCDGKNELKIPLVVLVNAYSASASEILAGALQDYQMGPIIGQATFGKAVVQRLFNMADETAVKMTISSYFTPLGRSLADTGIIPDIEIELDREAYYEEDYDNQLEAALTALRDEIY